MKGPGLPGFRKQVGRGFYKSPGFNINTSNRSPMKQGEEDEYDQAKQNEIDEARKRLIEAQERGEFRELRFGTHKMTIFKSRFQGEDARGHQDFHRRTLPDGSFRYENNYLNVNISNFKVEERGSLESIIRRQSGIVDLNDQDHDDGDLL